MLRDEVHGMCWSAEVSLNTFLLTAFTTFLVWFNGSSMFLPIVMMAYGIMQLNEYFIWKYLGNPTMNMLLSIAAAVIIALQPLVSLTILHDRHSKVVFACGYMLFLFIYIASLLLRDKTHKFQTVVAKNGHLRWMWWKNISYVACYLYLLLLLVPMYLEKEWFTMFSLIVLLIVSMITYGKDGTWTSMWCWMVNMIAIYLLIKMFFYDTMCQYTSR
jgi:hypothetical protein